MSTKVLLLKHLIHADDYISGNILASALNISRNAVWKSIHALNAEGFTIVSHAHLGYRLMKTPLSLNDTLLRCLLNTTDVFLYDTIDSTNTRAKAYAPNLSNDFAIFLANEQTQGRGRLGRSFHSPHQSGIYFSLLYPAKSFEKHLSVLTHLTAVAVSRAIESICHQSVEIKWVNDLFLNGKKICGILTEAITSVEINRVEQIIIGIGINLYSNPDLPEHLETIVGHLVDEPINKNDLVVAISEHIQQLLYLLPSLDFLKEYRNRCFILNQPITVHHSGESYPAIAREITDSGELLVETHSLDLKRLSFGEISIRYHTSEEKS